MLKAAPVLAPNCVTITGPTRLPSAAKSHRLLANDTMDQLLLLPKASTRSWADISSLLLITRSIWLLPDRPHRLIEPGETVRTGQGTCVWTGVVRVSS